MADAIGDMESAFHVHDIINENDTKDKFSPKIGGSVTNLGRDALSVVIR